MDFYIMKYSADLKIVGKFPQMEKMFDGFNALEVYEAWGIIGGKQVKEPIKQISGFKLRYHSKLTDLISFVQVGFNALIMSKRFYDLLQTFNCMPFISVESELTHRSNTYSYKFVLFQDVYPQYIDFNKSRFYIGFSSNWKSDVTISSYEEYHRKTKELESLRDSTNERDYLEILELHINSSMVVKDVFLLPNMAAFIVSSRLKAAIEEMAISGVKFLPAQGYIKHVMDYSVNPPRQIT